MKSILISIRPEHLINILNGKKTLELRKSVPKDFKGWVNLYCTKARQCTRVSSFISVCEDELYKLPNGVFKYGSSIELMGIGVAGKDYNKNNFLNGKVVARFWFDEYEKVECRTVPYLKNGTKYDNYIENGVYEVENTKIDNYGVVFERDDELIETMFNNNDLKKMCLSPQELHDYIGLGNNGYAWHIKQLEIFDTPLNLNDFYVTNKGLIYKYIKEYEEHTNDTISFRLKRPPQSWQYIYAKEDLR